MRPEKVWQIFIFQISTKIYLH